MKLAAKTSEYYGDAVKSVKSYELCSKKPEQIFIELKTTT